MPSNLSNLFGSRPETVCNGETRRAVSLQCARPLGRGGSPSNSIIESNDEPLNLLCVKA